jgi:ethanolamine ammonia-lyase small subunit
MKKPSENKATGLKDNAWSSLKTMTDARIALGRTGVSLPTDAQLAFARAHASARDAVHIPLDVAALQTSLKQVGLTSFQLHSQADNRSEYLRRPDKGRRLSAESASMLKSYAGENLSCDVCVVIADGLSSMAVQKHAEPTADALVKALKLQQLSCAPVCIVEQGRVAIGDEIGELLGCRLLILLVGERPGLSSPDSLGIYFTLNPRVGLTDAQRNCISNIRPEGMQVMDAVERLLWLVQEAMRIGKSGVELKDRSGNSDGLEGHISQNFLLGQ